MVKAVRGAADERAIDLLQVEYQQMVPLVQNVPAKKSILDLHNIESALVDSYAARPAAASPLCSSARRRSPSGEWSGGRSVASIMSWW